VVAGSALCRVAPGASVWSSGSDAGGSSTPSSSTTDEPHSVLAAIPYFNAISTLLFLSSQRSIVALDLIACSGCIGPIWFTGGRSSR
jgi:hypothetical protein